MRSTCFAVLCTFGCALPSGVNEDAGIADGSLFVLEGESAPIVIAQPEAFTAPAVVPVRPSAARGRAVETALPGLARLDAERSTRVLRSVDPTRANEPPSLVPRWILPEVGSRTLQASDTELRMIDTDSIEHYALDSGTLRAREAICGETGNTTCASSPPMDTAFGRVLAVSGTLSLHAPGSNSARWETQVEPPGVDSAFAGVDVCGDVLVSEVFTRQQGTSYVGVDAQTGALLWRQPAPLSGATRTADSERFYVRVRAAQLVAFDCRTGVERWQRVEQGSSYMTMPPVVTDGRVYFDLPDGTLSVIDAQSGAELDRWPWDITRLRVREGTALVTRVDGEANRASAIDVVSGRMLWTCEEPVAYASEIIGDGDLLVARGALDATVLLIDARDGRVLLRQTLVPGAELEIVAFTSRHELLTQVRMLGMGEGSAVIAWTLADRPAPIEHATVSGTIVVCDPRCAPIGRRMRVRIAERWVHTDRSGRFHARAAGRGILAIDQVYAEAELCFIGVPGRILRLDGSRHYQIEMEADARQCPMLPGAPGPRDPPVTDELLNP